jgi:hypothetical protein
MSRRPRAPLSLRPLGREPSLRPALEIDPGASERLVDPRPSTATVTLPPEPAVDVVPASLVSATFALRRVELHFPPAVAETAELLRAESRPVAILELPRSQAAHPAAALVRRISPLPLDQVQRPVLRECLEALYRSSGAADANDLALVGIYDRVPIGAIAGASATPHGLELRLRAGTRARRGLLVVGRRRASGALVTAEVATQVAPK